MFALLTLKKFMILFGGMAFFFKLINCGISKTFIEILRFMYNNVRACVKTNNELTDFFSNDITDIFHLSCEPGGGGYLGQVLLGMCRWPLRTPTQL